MRGSMEKDTMQFEHDGHEKMGEFFDKCAREGVMVEFESDERERLGRFMRAWDIRPGMRILEPGCGSGRLTAVLAEAAGEAGEIWACDLSKEMIRLARQRGLPARVRFLQEPVTRIQCEDGYFDRIICLNVFPHFLDPAMVLRAFRRVLRDTGQLWINHFMARDELNGFHRNVGPEVSRHKLPCRDTMQRLLDEAGFHIGKLSDGPEGYALVALPSQ